MDRLACISIPALPLQLALHRLSPGLRLPVALVKDDRPASPILNLNSRAKDLGLKPGMRYGEALSLVGDLRALVVSEAEVAEARGTIRQILRMWSPDLEDCPFDPGAFWVGTSGLTTLFGDESQWGAAVRQALAGARFRAFVVVGGTREGTYLVARHLRRSTVIPTPEAEAKALLKVPLTLLPLSVRHRRRLQALGILTWGALINLPQAEVSKRFGTELLQEIRQVKNLGSVPLQTAPVFKPLERKINLDYAVSNLTVLLPILGESLQSGLDDLALRGNLLEELTLEFVLESGEVVTEVLRPSHPNNSYRILSRLVDLRVGEMVLVAGVVEIRLRFLEVASAPVSGDLFTPPVSRDLKKGEEVLALIRAQLGNEAVLTPGVGNSHIPGESFRWSRVGRLQPPVPMTGDQNFQVRRILFEPDPKTTSTAGKRIAGPYQLQISTGKTPVDREYWFLENFRREVHWVYWDRQDKRAVWEGVVD